MPPLKTGGHTYPGSRGALLQGVKIHMRRKLTDAMSIGLARMEAKAKEKAPVRDIFYHGRRPQESAILKAERGVKVIRKSLEKQRAFLTLVKTQRPRQHEATLVRAMVDRGIPRIIRDARGRTDVERVRGSAFTFHPLVTTESGEVRAGVPGEGAGLRDVTGFGFDAKTGTIGLPLRARRGRPELERQGSRETVLVLDKDIRDLLGPRGREEVIRHARIITRVSQGLPPLKNSAFYTNIAGRTTIGGRLRDEIYSTNPKVSDTRIEGWVISPTPYAKYQEWGSSHNRASPYMRPALYEMRSEFKRIVERHLGVKR